MTTDKCRAKLERDLGWSSPLGRIGLSLTATTALLTGCVHATGSASHNEGGRAYSRSVLKILSFRISPNEVTSETVAKTVFMMKERLHVAQIKGTIVSTQSGYLEVTLDARLPVPYSSRLLTQMGYVTFKTLPKGDVYRSPSVRPIRSAVVESPEYAAEHSGVISQGPTLFFKMSDPVSFRRFTAAHLRQSLGIYLDGRLVSAPELMSPISDSGMITSNFDARELDFIAAVMNAGPLPVHLRFISASGVIRS